MSFCCCLYALIWLQPESITFNGFLRYVFSSHSTVLLLALALSAVMVYGLFLWRPCDMELVIRQSERSGHQQRLLQAFTEDIFIFSLFVYIAY